MDIGPYTFEEFKQKAADFHGYPAPGLLLGGYMAARAKAALPEGTLFEALVETKKCLPDAVQLLTLCSVGNNWLKILNLGRYALSLFDKYSGAGVRVHIAPEKLADYPEIAGWFFKRKEKKDQDADLLLREIEDAGDSVCSLTPIRVHPRFLVHARMGSVSLCPRCGEAFPTDDGPLCRGCQGEAPYVALETAVSPARPRLHVVRAEDAVGRAALHDMTEVVPGKSKGAAFSAGQTISAGDVCRLQKMGRFSVAVAQEPEEAGERAAFIHENDGVATLAARMAGENVRFSLPAREGKIDFRAAADGLFTLDRAGLTAFNMMPDVMAASRQDGMLVEEGAALAGARILPLHISREHFAQALALLNAPLFSVVPLRRARVGILVTGTEVFKGLVRDAFIPVISAKVEQLRCSVVKSAIAPDDKAAIRESIEEIRAAGADLLVVTGGLSVDPEDISRAALLEAGLTDALYGAPVLPGAMSLTGFLPSPDQPAAPGRQGKLSAGSMQVIGVPACALHHKTTLFDALLPRLLAGRELSRAELAALGEGGFCLNCKVCAWPKCFFMK
jgi:formylmethanofuran dehydrogenase subunit E